MPQPAPFPNGVNMQNTHTSGSGVTKSFKTTVRSCPDVIEMSKIMRLWSPFLFYCMQVWHYSITFYNCFCKFNCQKVQLLCTILLFCMQRILRLLLNFLENQDEGNQNNSLVWASKKIKFTYKVGQFIGEKIGKIVILQEQFFTLCSIQHKKKSFDASTVQVHFFKLDTLVLCKMSLWSQQDSLFGGQVGG